MISFTDTKMGLSVGAMLVRALRVGFASKSTGIPYGSGHSLHVLSLWLSFWVVSFCSCQLSIPLEDLNLFLQDLNALVTLCLSVCRLFTRMIPLGQFGIG